MKRFRFKFDRLRKIRERKEEAALLRLSLAQTNLAREEKLLADLADAVEGSGTQLSALMQEGAPVEMLRNADAFRTSASAAAGRQKGTARQADEAAAEKRKEFREAHQDAEAMRRLHNRRREDHRKESLREMQRELDEIGARGAKGAGSRQAGHARRKRSAR